MSSNQAGPSYIHAEVAGGLYNDLLTLIASANTFLHGRTEPLVVTSRSPAGEYRAVLHEIVRTPRGPIILNDILLTNMECSAYKPTRYAALLDLLERLEMRVWYCNEHDVMFGSTPRPGFDTHVGGPPPAQEESGEGR